MDAKPPLWRRPWVEGRLSVLVDPIPTAGDPIPTYTFCACSSSPATLVANLALALSVAGSNPDELVKSFETRRQGDGYYLQSLTCIPTSRVL